MSKTPAIDFTPYYAAARRKSAAILVEKAATPGDQALIEQLASKLEPKLAKALLEAFEKQASAINVAALADALKTGNVEGVLSSLGLDGSSAAFESVKSALQNGVWEAGMATAQRVGPLRRIEFVFNRLNPVLVEWLKGYEYNLVKEVNKATKETLRELMVEGMKAGENPRTTAREIKQVFGLTQSQRRAVKNFRKELETFHTKRNANDWNLGGKISRAPGGAQTYALNEDGSGPADGINSRRLRDFRYDGQLKKALQTKKPLTKAQIDKMVKAYTRKYLKYRAETIARTEAMRASNVGVQESWRQMIESGKVAESLVRRQWIVSKDERTCPVCKPIPSMNPKMGVQFGVPFATPIGPVMLPPGTHPNCRCTVFIRLYEPVQLTGSQPIKSLKP